MPAATIRRNGAVNSSRGRASSSIIPASTHDEDRTVSPNHDSTDAVDDDLDATSSNIRSDSISTAANDNGTVNIQQVIREFEQRSFPVTRNVMESRLAVTTRSWEPIDRSIDDLITTVTEWAERKAETLSITMAGKADTGDDPTLQTYDQLCRRLIDLKQETAIRTGALDGLRHRVVERHQPIDDAAETYKTQTKNGLDTYMAKTQRQRYGTQKGPYERYRTKVWDALTSEPMPPIGDLLPSEEQDGQGGADEDEDEIAVYGNAAMQYKCPLTLRIMVDPRKSTTCQHAYEKSAIEDYLGSATKPCPAGCTARLHRRTLVEDPEFTRECRTFARRQERRQEQQRTHVEATMID